MLLHNYGVRNRQALTRAFAHRLSSKERVEYLRLNLRRDAWPRVGDLDLRPICLPAGHDADGALGDILSRNFRNSVRAIHNQV